MPTTSRPAHAHVRPAAIAAQAILAAAMGMVLVMLIPLHLVRRAIRG